MKDTRIPLYAELMAGRKAPVRFALTYDQKTKLIIAAAMAAIVLVPLLIASSL